MKGYKHLSENEREKIAQLEQSQISLSEIARQLGKHKSTISRELKRNEAPPGHYWPDRAQRLYKKRRAKVPLLDKDLTLQEFIKTKLICHFWTPEQIAAELKKGIDCLPYASHETIYRWIYSKAQKGEKLWKYLPRHKAKRGLRKSKNKGGSRIHNRVSIHERPNIDQEFGHWEGDLMAFKRNSQHIVVLRERKSMLTLSAVLPSKKTADVMKTIRGLTKKIPQQALMSITFDNGTEFADHHKLGLCNTYFCDAYASWQKGGVENTNGRLRRDLPRYLDVKQMQKEDFDEIIDNYNLTPRKKLQWKTPSQAFTQNLHRVALHT